MRSETSKKILSETSEEVALRQFESYLDEVAEEKGFINFKSLYYANINYLFTLEVIKESVQKYKEDACKVQREICDDK